MPDQLWQYLEIDQAAQWQPDQYQLRLRDSRLPVFRSWHPHCMRTAPGQTGVEGFSRSGRRVAPAVSSPGKARPIMITSMNIGKKLGAEQSLCDWLEAIYLRVGTAADSSEWSALNSLPAPHDNL